MSSPERAEGDDFQSAIDDIEAAVLGVIGRPVKRMIDDLVAELSPVGIGFGDGTDNVEEGLDAAHGLPFDQHDATLTGHVLGVRCMVAHGQRLYTGGADYRVHIWDVVSRRIVNTLNHGATITCMAISSDGDRLVTGSSSRSVKLWNALDGTLLATVSGRAPLSLLATGNVLLGGHNKCLKVWSSESLEERLSVIGKF